MHTFESFESFWEDYHARKPNDHGFRDWVIVDVLHMDDESFRDEQASGSDGLQPLSVTLAHAMTQKTDQVLVKRADDQQVRQLKAFLRDEFVQDFPSRFGSFRPGATQAFAEYDSWDSFYSSWLEREGKPVFDLNMPLLIDHTPKLEYWTRKKTSQEVLAYQRLLITTYFVSKRQFFDFFIRDVDDSEAERIKLLLQSRIGLHKELLYKDGAS